MISSVVDLIVVVVLIALFVGEAYLLRPAHVLAQVKTTGFTGTVNKVCIYVLFWTSIGAIVLTLALSVGIPAPQLLIDVLALFILYTFLFYIFQIFAFGLHIGGRIGASLKKAKEESSRSEP